MPHVAAYTEITAPRWGKEESDRTIAAKHPKYIYGTSRNSCLIHKISYVELKWWTYGGNGQYLVRLQSPRMFAITYCQRHMFLDGTKSKTCALPRPDAVLCARCHGNGTNFPHGRKHEIPKELAKVRLGCIVEAA